MSWRRIEGSNRDPDLDEGLAAAIADPLWTLARQWQVGEFHGEDAASPILMTAEVSAAPITAYAPGDGGRGTDLDDRPIEVLVEQEPVDDDVALPLELGWALLRGLAGVGASIALRDRIRADHPAVVPDDDGLDPVGRARLELLARRSCDGHSAAAAVRAAGGPDPYLTSLGLKPGMVRRLRPVVRAWLSEAGDIVRLPERAASWQEADLEYQFRVAAPAGSGRLPGAELQLAATEYAGGRLDWYHFGRSKGRQLGADGGRANRELTVIPTPLSFNGMPAPRFWEIEDHAVSFGHLAGGEEDLARAVVGGFAAVYRDDWSTIPCTLPVGSVARVVRITAIDDYGQQHEIPATAAVDGPDRVWRFFEIDGDDGPDHADPDKRTAPLLVLAPALPDVEQGPPLERVDFRRDELANLVWAIERRAVGAAGRSVDRDAAAAPVPEPAASDDRWSYRAFRPVPEHWIPLVPVMTTDDKGDPAATHLRRGRMAETVPGVDRDRLLPMSRVLDASRPLRIREEAIPDAGLRVERRYQRTRGPDGRVHLWMGRRVRYGATRRGGRHTTDTLHPPGG